MQLNDTRIGVIGLGYVGLPLALAFAETYPVTGFDIDPDRIAELSRQHDRTGETDKDDWAAAKDIRFTQTPEHLRACNVFIVTVPTPVDDARKPDLGPLIAASETAGRVIKRGDIVIYESTVYPGATEEDCIPVIERASGLTYGADFEAGYSPERINPGDKSRRIQDIRKITSGSTKDVGVFVDALYGSIITAGTYLAPSIKVAEAAKVIENVQRDVNIALINELALIFDRMGLDTLDVLDAAATKWNFQRFTPGLVGGHCIGVDPYYLTHKAQSLGYHPQMVLSGRRINDGMGAWLAQRLVRELVLRDKPVKNAKVLILGLAFKEDVPDLRNTRVLDVKSELESFGISVDVHDPLVDANEARRVLGVTLCDPIPGIYDAAILAVPHKSFRDARLEGSDLFRDDPLILDLKGVLDRSDAVIRI
jgi:UDP-N-acetyl-D-galactosamine dehydrogenase